MSLTQTIVIVALMITVTGLAGLGLLYRSLRRAEQQPPL